MPPQKFNVGLVQMSTTSDPDKNLQRAIDKVHEAAARGAQIVCLPELFQTQYFCQREDATLVRSGRTHSRTGHRPDLSDAGEAASHRPDRIAVREARPGRVSQHRRDLRRGRFPARPLSQDAHSRRPALLRKVLLHARRSRLPRLRHRRRPRGHAGLLGPVVSGRRAPDRAAGRADAFLSDRDWLASLRESRVRPVAARRLAHHSTRPRHRQWRVRGGGESCGIRNWRHPRQRRARRRPGILGRLFPVRSLRPGHRRSLA